MSVTPCTNGLDITGVNFLARIQWGAPTRTWLAVNEEAELVTPIVIENFMRILSARQALCSGGLLLHSAGVVIHGLAHIFPGYSGSGKTTLTRKAREAGQRILSDDMNLLLPDRTGHIHAYAVPFAGEFGQSSDAVGAERFPVAAIHSIKQGESLHRKSLTFSAAVARLTASAPFVNTDPQSVGDLIDVASNIAEQVRVDELTLRRDTPFEDLIEMFGA